MHKNKRFTEIFNVLVLMTFLAICSDGAIGQEAVIKGTVTDKEENSLKNVKITLLDPEIGRKIELRSNKEGKFIKVGIPPATYKIRVELETYNTFQSQVVVRYGQEEYVNIKLQKILLAESDDRDLAEGINYYQANQYDQAIASFKKVIEKIPSSLSARRNLGLSYLRKGDADMAITTLEKAIKLNPEAIELYFALGESYFKNKEEEKARDVFLKAVDLQPNNPKAYYNLGISYCKNDKNEFALAAFEKAIQLDPIYASAYYQAGLAYVKKGDVEKAINLLNEFLKLEPEAPETKHVKDLINALNKGS